MTAISSLGAGQMSSPLSRLQSELTSQVSAGAISSGDQSALSSALTDIDSALRGQGAQGGPPPSPDEMQSKLNSLIENEVKSGKLTSDQAGELKDVFAKAFQGGPQGAGGSPKTDSSQAGSLEFRFDQRVVQRRHQQADQRFPEIPPGFAIVVQQLRRERQQSRLADPIARCGHRRLRLA